MPVLSASAFINAVSSLNSDGGLSTPAAIYYEDHGSSSPVVLVHGYALNGPGSAWEAA